VKKQAILLSLAALGMIVGSNAFASRAVTLVNGTGDAGVVLDAGSFYYDDNYNMFYNPSYINDFKNWATIEKSNSPGTTAQGGFVTSFSNFNFGLYLNRGNAVRTYAANGVATAGIVQGAAAYTAAPIRPIEVFVGGDAGVKWGLGLTWASVAGAASNSSNLVLNLGAQIAGLDPFFNIAVIAKDGATTTHPWWRLGARYHFGEWTPYVAVVRTAVKDSAVAATEATEMTIGGGVGRSAKVAEGVRMNYAVAYFNINDKNVSANVSNKRHILPIDFSMEGDALSWLTLRAGLQYRLMDRYAGGASLADATRGRLGASVHFTKAAHMDFAVGNAASTTEVTAGANAADAQTFGFDRSLFTAANFTYTW
jgi:hypothetical protein